MPKKAKPLSKEKQKEVLKTLEEQGNFFKSLRTGTMRRWRSTTTPEDRAPGPVKKITLTDEERKRYESM